MSLYINQRERGQGKPILGSIWIEENSFDLSFNFVLFSVNHSHLVNTKY